MKSRIILSFILLIISSFVMGCQKDQPTAAVTPSKTASATETKPPAQEIGKAVEAIKINEAPANSPSPSHAVLKQFEVIFENKVSSFPEEDSILTESIVGNHGILTIRSPEGSNRYAIFLYENKEEWTMDGLMRLGAVESDYYTDSEGLELPFKGFNSDKLSVKAEEDGREKEVWAFLDDKKIITVARFEQLPFDNLSDKTVSLENGNPAYITKDANGNSFLYYFDSKKTIVVSGNITEEELIVLANSLPASSAINFPSHRE